MDAVTVPDSLVPAASNAMALADKGFTARRNFFNFFGIRCEIKTAEGQTFLHVKLKAFKLKEDITVYADEALSQPVLTIRARQILDISAAYDVVDAVTGEKVGVLKRKGLKSILKDEWEILDPQDQPIGLMAEDSVMMAMLRRFLSNLIPQDYTLTIGESQVAAVHGTWNPFIVSHEMDLSADAEKRFDRRLALAASVLLMVIEGKQG